MSEVEDGEERAGKIVLESHHTRMEFRDYGVMYSAVVASVALGWNIYAAVKTRTGRIEVKADFITSFMLGQSVDATQQVRALVTNHSQEPRFLRTVGLRMDVLGQLRHYMQIQSPVLSRDLPKKLERGEQYSIFMDFDSLRKFAMTDAGMKRNFPNSGFRQSKQVLYFRTS